jgi:hypothetical protein
MARPAGYKQWSAQVGETNKCAKEFLLGTIPQGVMDKFFDHESQMFQEWGGPPQDKDWSEDTNR